MTRCVDHLRLKSSPAKNVSLFQQLINVGELRREYAEESSLHVHRMIKRQAVAMHKHGRAGGLMKFAQAADAIDVGLGAVHGFYVELIAAEEDQSMACLVARIPHQPLPS